MESLHTEKFGTKEQKETLQGRLISTCILKNINDIFALHLVETIDAGF